jgi:glucuronosyltransferase
MKMTIELELQFDFYRTYEYSLYPKMEKSMRKRYNFSDLPSVKEIDQKTVLMLVNSDNAIDYPEPIQPNMVQVGGMQIGDSKPLPEVSFILISI